MALTCLFVASKVEETVRKCRDLIVGSWSTINPQEQELDVESDVKNNINTARIFQTLLLLDRRRL